MFSIYNIAGQNKSLAQILNKASSSTSNSTTGNQSYNGQISSQQNYQSSLFSKSGASESSASKLNTAILKQLNYQAESFSSSLAQLNSGVSMLEFGGASAKNIGTSLKNLQSLALEASAATLTQNDRGDLQVKAEKLKLSIQTEVTTAEFDGQKVLASSTVIQIEYQSALLNSSKGSSKLRTTNLADQLSQSGLMTLDFSSAESSSNALSKINDMIKSTGKTEAMFNGQSKNLLKNVAAIQKGASRLESLKAYYEKQSSRIDLTAQLAQTMNTYKSQAYSAQANINATQMVSILGGKYNL